MMATLLIIMGIVFVGMAFLFWRAFRSFLYPADGENGIEIKEKNEPQRRKERREGKTNRMRS